MLHAGHLALIETVVARHQKVLVFLGSTPGVLVTRRNPLDFQTRRLMLHEAFPEIDVLPLPNVPSDDDWSRELDRRIREVCDGHSIQLYGSRDGFCPHYTGQHPVVELESRHEISGSEVRKSASDSVRRSTDFRRGVVYAAFNRHATSYQAVDVACVRERGTAAAQVLLFRKETDEPGRWRFFGGFVQPNLDASLEAAASREFHEESGGLGIHMPAVYLGSFLVPDWRYIDESDSIMTALFLFDYAHGDARASDDIDEVRWFELAGLEPATIVPDHQPLFARLVEYLATP